MKATGCFLDKCIALLTYLGAGMGILAVFALVIMISANVLLRYFFNKPLIHAFELSGYFFIVIAYLGFAYAVRAEAHISVNFVAKRFPPKGKGVLEVITSIIALLVVAIYLRYAADQFGQSLMTGKRAWTTLETPLWIPQIILVIGLALFALEIIARIVKKAMVPPLAQTQKENLDSSRE